MAVLILRFSGPLQSWGNDSNFNFRRTSGYPTKSGVIGFIASALGYSRTDSLKPLSDLKICIRVDKEGKLLRDYQTVKSSNGKDSYIVNKYYLSDATFVVGIEGSSELIGQIEQAIKNPAYPLFLGRRSCVPTLPIVLGKRDEKLIEAVKNEPLQALIDDGEGSKRKLKLIIDAEPDEDSDSVCDMPLSFSPKNRRHTWRSIKVLEFTKSIAPEHDAFAALEG